MVPSLGSSRPPTLTRVFVSSMVSGYSILRTLIALLEKKTASVWKKKKTKALPGGKSPQKFLGYIHFLRTQDSKLHLRHQVSAHLQYRQIQKDDKPPRYAVMAQKTARLLRTGMPWFIPETELEELNMGNPDPPTLFREDGLLWAFEMNRLLRFRMCS